LAGRYRLTGVEHVYGAGRPYVTRFVCGGKDAADLADLLGTGGPTADRRGWGSLVVGLVTNNEDTEKLGRVKVKFPTLSDDDESTWARLVTPGGGADRGMQWLPEVGDEVLVGFELDDKTRPVVLGGMWSRRDKPPEAAPINGGKTTTRILASRRDHRLVFTDDQTSAVDLTLGDSSTKLHLEQQDSALTGEKNLTVSAERITIKGTKKITIDAPEVEITGSEQLKLSSKMIKLN
jgi:uncharacterized protein involved in type VI secretion and phage assembly